jgi:hypothetical protein
MATQPTGRDHNHTYHGNNAETHTFTHCSLTNTTTTPPEEGTHIAGWHDGKHAMHQTATSSHWIHSSSQSTGTGTTGSLWPSTSQGKPSPFTTPCPDQTMILSYAPSTNTSTMSISKSRNNAHPFQKTGSSSLAQTQYQDKPTMTIVEPIRVSSPTPL